MTSNKKTPSQNVEQLNGLLAGELSAVETYGECVQVLDDAEVAAQLRVLRSSHQHRAEILARRVMDLGGTPKVQSGLWGTLADVLQREGDSVPPSVALPALEQGEAHGLSLYQRGLERLAIVERKFVQDVLLPEQQRSCEFLQNIGRRVSTSHD